MFVDLFNPNGPKCDTSKEVPNGGLFTKKNRDHFLEQSLFLIEAIVVTGSHFTKLMHNECSPLSNSPDLDTIVKFMLDRFDCLGHTKDTLLRN